MRPLRRALAFAALLLGTVALAAPAVGAGDHVARLRLLGVIDQVNAAYIEEGIRTAADGGAAAVLIEIDSPGGELTSMDRILKAILASPVPVITYVTPDGARAASAATFVTLAGDVAAMAPLTNIGAASVIDSSGNDLPATLGRKVVSRVTRAMRSSASRASPQRCRSSNSSQPISKNELRARYSLMAPIASADGFIFSRAAPVLLVR